MHRPRQYPGRTRAALVIAALATVLIASIAPGSQQLAAGASPAAGSAVSVSRSVERDYLDAGVQTVVDKRNVSLTVSQTTGLKSLQQISVAWTGAHQTGGILPDSNSDLAQNEEYSFDLFECRGTDSATAPAAQQLSPQTCWTQFADERFADGVDSYPAWRSDEFAPAADRSTIVGAPVPGSAAAAACANDVFGTVAQRWVPFAEASGVTDIGGPSGCAGEAPEASPTNSSSLTLPSNETYGITAADGTGSAKFDVFTAEDHASLGCSLTVACSLVAVPIEGISCDIAGALAPATDPVPADAQAGARANCETAGQFAPGSPAPNGSVTGTAAVDGALWWSASNWRNRITVPLTFAPPDNICSVTNASTPVEIYGSELMTQATTQWAPAFCQNSTLFNLKHVQTPEPEARTLLNSGGIEAAFTSNAPDTAYTTPTVNAPVAVTGFGIAFDVDDGSKKPATAINLTARLLAKLMTESYPDQNFVKTTYPATDLGGGQSQATLSTNPLNITSDPEFIALNPNIPRQVIDAAATLLSLDSGSDVIYALTSYLAADPEARAWLNGAPDPWGMTVNANYKNIALPVNSWPLLDSYLPTTFESSGINPCLQVDPVPWLPLVAAPTARLFSIGQDMQFAISQTQTSCFLPSPIPGSTAGAKMVAVGRQTPGTEFMLGVVSLGDAQREDLSLASLQTEVSSSAPVKFTSGAGRTFVTPTNTSLAAAARLLAPDPQTNSWPIPYSKFISDSSGAYPGTMVVYAAVPTQGLPAADATDYSKLLTFAAGTGQQPGTDQGELAPGYLPMTTANGLGALAAYTLIAANAVATQQGVVPAVSGPAAAPTPRGSGSPTFPSSSSSATGSSATSGRVATKGVTVTAPAGPAPPVGGAIRPKRASAAPIALAGHNTPEFPTGIGAELLPMLLLVVLGAAIAAAGIGLRPHRRRP